MILDCTQDATLDTIDLTLLDEGNDPLADINCPATNEYEDITSVCPEHIRDLAKRDDYLECLIASQNDKFVNTDFGNERTNVIYIAARTDGIDGDGSERNPRDGSTAAKLDAIVQAGSIGSHFRLGRGTFYTNGTHANELVGIHLKEGCTFRGSGMGVTILQVVNPGDTWYSAIRSGIDADRVHVSDLTIDVNWQTNFTENHTGVSVTLRGSNSSIKRVHSKNWGGDWNNLAECFVMAISKNIPDPGPYLTGGLIEDCIFTDPVSGGTNVRTYTACLTMQGQGRIAGNFVDGQDVSLVVKGGGASTFSNGTVVYENNVFRKCSDGIHGDSHPYNKYIIRNNFFDRCAIAMSLIYKVVATNPQFGWAIVENNEIRLPTDGTASTGGAAGRFDGGALATGWVRCRNNTVYVDDGVTFINEGSFAFFNLDFVDLGGNVYEKDNIGAGSFGITDSVKAFRHDPEFDTEGYQYFKNVSPNASSIQVISTHDSDHNGQRLFDALSVSGTLGSSPHGIPRSLLNTFTVKVDSGDYNLPSVALLPSFTVIQGTGAKSTTIRCSTDTAVRTNGAKEGVIFRDLTACGDGNPFINVAGVVPNLVDGIFERVHFAEKNGGTVFPDGASGIAARLVDCTADITLADGLNQNNFYGEVVGCNFPKGFFANLVGAELRDSVFGEDGTAVSGFLAIQGGTKIERCSFFGDGVIRFTASGTIDDSIFVMSRGSAGEILRIFAGCKLRRVSVIASGSASLSIDALVASNASISNCTLNKVIGGNVTNLVVTPYNVIDANA